MSKEEHMLTTVDNPFNPFTQFDDWYQFDTEKGYNSLGYLARIACTSNELSKADNDEEIEFAIDEIISLDPFSLYCKVTKDSIIKPIKVELFETKSE